MSFTTLPFIQNGLAIFPESSLVLTLLVVIVLELTLSQKRSNWLLVASFIGFIIAISTLLLQWHQAPLVGFGGSLHIDRFSVVFRCIIAISSALCIPLSVDYLKQAEIALGEFLIFLLTATLGAMLLCSANDLITIFVALECLSLPCYLLAGSARRDVRSSEASMKYLLMGGASSAILVYGFSWLYGLSGGNIELNEVARGLFLSSFNFPAIWVALVCTVVGIGFKVSVVPFHQWTPDVYEGAPTPVVAFLSVGSKAAGLAVATRLLSSVFPVLQQEWHTVLEVLAILSMIFGNFIAITQTSMKRMLAYSSISQIGYLMMGLIAGSSDGYASMTFYMIIYTFMNLGAFACVIVFSLRTGTDQIRDYTGLSTKDPWLVFCLSICLLSLGGIPPLAGFFGKIYLFWSGWQSKLRLLVYVALITSVISIYYYLRLIKLMTTRETAEMSFYVRDYIRRPFSIMLRNPIEISIVLCVFVSTTLGIVMNPVIVAVQDALLFVATISP